MEESGEELFLVELPAIFPPPLRFVDTFYPMRRAAKDELALRRLDENVLAEQATLDRLSFDEAAKIPSRSHRLELRVADFAEPLRVFPGLFHPTSMHSAPRSIQFGRQAKSTGRVAFESPGPLDRR